MTQTIPESVLASIVQHRPHLASIVDNLHAHPERAAQFEKPLADAYLMGEVRLLPADMWKLSFCCIGERYGGGKR